MIALRYDTHEVHLVTCLHIKTHSATCLYYTGGMLIVKGEKNKWIIQTRKAVLTPERKCSQIMLKLCLHAE